MNAADLRAGCAIALAAASAALAPLAAGAEERPRYSYLDASFLWSDVNYAVRLDDSRHEGFRIAGSVALADWLHIFGDYYDGDFNVRSESVSNQDLDFTGYSAGFGLSYPIAAGVDLVGRAAYVYAELEDVDDDGFMIEAMVRAMITDRAEFQVGYTYTEMTGDDIDSRDVSVALLYNFTRQFAFRTKAIIFDNDTGIEFGVRFNFGDDLLKLF